MDKNGLFWAELKNAKNIKKTIREVLVKSPHSVRVHRWHSTASRRIKELRILNSVELQVPPT